MIALCASLLRKDCSSSLICWLLNPKPKHSWFRTRKGSPTLIFWKRPSIVTLSPSRQTPRAFTTQKSRSVAGYPNNHHLVF